MDRAAFNMYAITRARLHRPLTTNDFSEQITQVFRANVWFCSLRMIIFQFMFACLLNKEAGFAVFSLIFQFYNFRFLLICLYFILFILVLVNMLVNVS